MSCAFSWLQFRANWPSKKFVPSVALANANFVPFFA